MCTTVERNDGTEVAGTVAELRNLIGADGKLVLWKGDTEDTLVEDACLCQLDLDATLKENNIDCELDESTMYYRLK